MCCEKIDVCKNNGLNAIQGGYRNKIRCEDTRKIKFSVDFDTCCKKEFPNSNRWDYLIVYNEKNYFVEIHKAEPSEVKVVIAKSKWIKQLLKECKKNITGTFHWLATGKTTILGKYQKSLAIAGIDGPKKTLECRG